MYRSLLCCCCINFLCLKSLLCFVSILQASFILHENVDVSVFEPALEPPPPPVHAAQFADGAMRVQEQVEFRIFGGIEKIRVPSHYAEQDEKKVREVKMGIFSSIHINLNFDVMLLCFFRCCLLKQPFSLDACRWRSVSPYVLLCCCC